jgi:hypothetical protein
MGVCEGRGTCRRKPRGAKQGQEVATENAIGDNVVKRERIQQHGNPTEAKTKGTESLLAKKGWERIQRQADSMEAKTKGTGSLLAKKG